MFNPVGSMGLVYLSTIKPSKIKHFMCITVNILFIPWIRHGNQSWILCEIKRSILGGQGFVNFVNWKRCQNAHFVVDLECLNARYTGAGGGKKGHFGMENILGFDYVVSGSIMSCIVLPCKGSKQIYIFEESGWWHHKIGWGSRCKRIFDVFYKGRGHVKRLVASAFMGSSDTLKFPQHSVATIPLMMRTWNEVPMLMWNLCNYAVFNAVFWM